MTVFELLNYNYSNWGGSCTFSCSIFISVIQTFDDRASQRIAMTVSI